MPELCLDMELSNDSSLRLADNHVPFDDKGISLNEMLPKAFEFFSDCGTPSMIQVRLQVSM